MSRSGLSQYKIMLTDADWKCLNLPRNLLTVSKVGDLGPELRIGSTPKIRYSKIAVCGDITGTTLVTSWTGLQECVKRTNKEEENRVRQHRQ